MSKRLNHRSILRKQLQPGRPLPEPPRPTEELGLDLESYFAARRRFDAGEVVESWSEGLDRSQEPPLILTAERLEERNGMLVSVDGIFPSDIGASENAPHQSIVEHSKKIERKDAILSGMLGANLRSLTSPQSPSRRSPSKHGDRKDQSTESIGAKTAGAKSRRNARQKSAAPVICSLIDLPGVPSSSDLPLFPASPDVDG